MDPTQLPPEVMQMMMSLGGQPSAEGAGGFGTALPGLPEQVSSLGNDEMPMVPPPAMDGGFMGGGAPETGPSAGEMSPEISQMVQALQGGGGAPEMGGDMGAPPEAPDLGLMPQPDANMAGQWAPGTGQSPDFNQMIPPLGNANNTSW